jgi:hypothetical protein
MTRTPVKAPAPPEYSGREGAEEQPRDAEQHRTGVELDPRFRIPGREHDDHPEAAQGQAGQRPAPDCLSDPFAHGELIEENRRSQKQRDILNQRDKMVDIHGSPIRAWIEAQDRCSLRSDSAANQSGVMPTARSTTRPSTP